MESSTVVVKIGTTVATFAIYSIIRTHQHGRRLKSWLYDGVIGVGKNFQGELFPPIIRGPLSLTCRESHMASPMIDYGRPVLTIQSSSCLKRIEPVMSMTGRDTGSLIQIFLSFQKLLSHVAWYHIHLPRVYCNTHLSSRVYCQRFVCTTYVLYTTIVKSA